MNTKTIAILLTVFNRKDLTIKCLTELKKQLLPEGMSYDVWLTNDGCTDGTPDAVREHFPEVQIIEGDGTLFWNRGMWTAWDAASKTKEYDYYLWLNDDTFLYEDCISSLITESLKNADKAIVLGPTQSLNHSATTYGGRVKEIVPIPQGSPIEVETFNGNIVLVPLEVFRTLGNLDYRFRHSRGDLDYGYRAKKSGIKMIQVGKHLGECDRHERLSTWCNPDVPLKKRLHVLKSPTQYNPSEAFYFERKHFGLPTAFFHYITLYLRCLCPKLWVLLGKAKI